MMKISIEFYGPVFAPRQHLFCQEIWPRAAEIWSTANPHIPEEDIVRWVVFDVFFSAKCVSNLGGRTADKAQKSKEVKKAFKATVYPASRHEEWVYGRWHDKPRLGIS